jgi:hypothetical protein
MSELTDRIWKLENRVRDLDGRLSGLIKSIANIDRGSEFDRGYDLGYNNAMEDNNESI